MLKISKYCKYEFNYLKINYIIYDIINLVWVLWFNKHQLFLYEKSICF